jgi:Flp pilus assembly protein TadG
MRLYRPVARRSGTTLIETVLTVTALLMLILGTVDLGIGTFRLHVLSEAARMGVRQAIVHGQMAPGGWNGGTWGPTTYTGQANSSDPKAQAIAPYLVGMDPSAVTVKYEWPDGNTNLESHVKVTVTATWTPLLGFIFGSSSTTLTGSSSMPIAH